MFYAQQETSQSGTKDGEWERISAITFSQSVHYTNAWCSILCKRIQIRQQLEKKKAAIFQTRNTITHHSSILD